MPPQHPTLTITLAKRHNYSAYSTGEETCPNRKRNLFEVTRWKGCLSPKSQLNPPQHNFWEMRDNGLTGRLNAAEERSSVGQRAGQSPHQVGVCILKPIFSRAGAAACSRKSPWRGKRAILMTSGTGAVEEELWFLC